jgi:hypothetical protein
MNSFNKRNKTCSFKFSVTSETAAANNDTKLDFTSLDNVKQIVDSEREPINEGMFLHSARRVTQPLSELQLRAGSSEKC